MKIKVGGAGAEASRRTMSGKLARLSGQSKVVLRLAKQIWFGRTIDARARQDGLSHQRMHRRPFTCHRRPTRAASLDCPYGKATWLPLLSIKSDRVCAFSPGGPGNPNSSRGVENSWTHGPFFSLLLVAMGSLSAQRLDWVHSCCTAGRKVAEDNPHNSGKSERHQYDPNIRREGDVQKI
jgi:hypothetical protein